MKKKLVVLILMFYLTGILAEENKVVGASVDLQSDPKVGINHKVFGRCASRIKKDGMIKAFIELKPDKVWKRTVYKNNSNFIRNIKTKISNKDVLNISFNKPVNLKYEAIAFNFVDFASNVNTIEYVITDNYKNKITKFCNISTQLSHINSSKTSN